MKNDNLTKSYFDKRMNEFAVMVQKEFIENKKADKAIVDRLEKIDKKVTALDRFDKRFVLGELDSLRDRIVHLENLLA